MPFKSPGQDELPWRLSIQEKRSKDSLMSAYVASHPTLFPSIILFYVFVFFPVHITIWIHSLLASHLTFPVHASLQGEGNKEVGLRRPATTSHSIRTHCPLLRVHWDLFTLMMLFFHTAPSFLPGQHPLGTLVYQPAYVCLNTGINCFHRAEGSGQTPNSHFWTSPMMWRACWSIPYRLGGRLSQSTHRTLRGLLFMSHCSPLEPHLWWILEYSVVIIRHKPRHKFDSP